MRAADDDEEEEEDCAALGGQASASSSLVVSTTGKNKRNVKDTRHLFVFSGGNKAGMDNSGLSMEQQQSIIYDASEGSAYMNHAENTDAKSTAKILDIQARLRSMTPTEVRTATIICTRKIEALEAHRSFSRHIVVLDMDSFYASVELRDRPDLIDKPVAIGSASGVISTANYIARKFGVRSAMAAFVALKLCPELIFLPTNFPKYQQVAEQVRDIIRRVDPHFLSISVDECIFDVTDAVLERDRVSKNREKVEVEEEEEGKEIKKEKEKEEEKEKGEEKHEEHLRILAEEIVAEIRNEIKYVTNGLTASAGIAHNSALAKICSNLKKPDGQYSLKPLNRQGILAFCSQLNTRQVGGIGRVGEKIFESIGVTTMGHALQYMPQIYHLFSQSTFNFYLSSALGICEGEGYARKLQNLPDTAVTRRSLGADRTMRDLTDAIAIRNATRDIAHGVAVEMKSENLQAKTVTLKLKRTNYEITTKAQTSNIYLRESKDIEKIALFLLDQQLKEEPDLKVRLIGVRVSRFKNEISSTERHIAAKHKSLDDFLSKTSAPITIGNQALSPGTTTKIVKRDIETCEGTDTGTGMRSGDIKEHLEVDLTHLGSQETDTEEEGEGEGEGQEEEDEQEQWEKHRGHAQDGLPLKRYKEEEQGHRQGSRYVPIAHVPSTSSSCSNERNMDYLTRTQRLKCPICFSLITSTQHQFNLHVDSCLNSSSQCAGKGGGDTGVVGSTKTTIGQFFALPRCQR